MEYKFKNYSISTFFYPLETFQQGPQPAPQPALFYISCGLNLRNQVGYFFTA